MALRASPSLALGLAALAALAALSALAAAGAAAAQAAPLVPPPPGLPTPPPPGSPQIPEPPSEPLPGPLDEAAGGADALPSPAPPDLAAAAPEWPPFLVGSALAALAGLVGLALWGGARFRDPREVLNHEVRSRIYRYIEGHVGASLKDITVSLGLSTTNAVWHLRKLEESSLVRGRKVNGARVYYATSGGVVARDLSLASAALASANARAVLGDVLAHSGAVAREVAERLGVNAGTARWHLQRLAKAGLLVHAPGPAGASYRAAPIGAEAWRRLAGGAAPGTMDPGGARVPRPAIQGATGLAGGSS